MLIWIFTLAAAAGTVQGGIQVAAFGSAFDFVAEQVTGQVFNIDRELVSQTDVGCYDEIGIRNLNISVPLDDLEFKLKENSLVIEAHFGRVSGEDMELYALDEDFVDLCPSFESLALYSFELTDARFSVELSPQVVGDRFELSVFGTPSISGNLDTDLEWVPDDLILSLVEDLIFEAIGDAISSEVPALASAMVNTSLFSGEVGDMQLDVDLTDLDTSASALAIAMDVDARWLGDGCTISGIATEPEGRNPRVNFAGSDGNDLAVGITEYQFNRLFHGAWADGLLCFEDGPLAELAEEIETLIGTQIERTDVALSFSQAPAISIHPDGIDLDLSGMHFSVSGMVDDSETLLIGMQADLNLGAELRIDHGLSAFTLSLITAELSINTFEAEALVDDTPEAKERLTALLEGWAMDTLATRLANVPLYGNLFHLAGIYLRVNSIKHEGGAVVIKVKLYDENDPEVDATPPETLARILGSDDDTLSFEMSAEDDNNGPFVYSYRLGTENWSTWSTENVATIPLPPPGEHNLAVQARDGWLNIDPSPAMLYFEVPAPTEDFGGCQCASSSNIKAAFGSGLVVLLMGLARRRE